MDGIGRGTPTFPDDPRWRDQPRLVWHWYDLICPFCYVGQDRSAILEQEGLQVVELGFEIHPETPAGGRFVGPREGALFDDLEQEAARAGLPLRWPDRVANSRRALSAVEWIRRAQPERANDFRRALFGAHFALGQDLADEAIILRHAEACGVSVEGLVTALRTGTADALLEHSERVGRKNGVDGTPSWLVAGRLVPGLSERADFEHLAQSVLQAEGAEPPL
jgi:predicted DsbA family dithiol-disulfide isomerase